MPNQTGIQLQIKHKRKEQTRVSGSTRGTVTRTSFILQKKKISSFAPRQSLPQCDNSLSYSPNMPQNASLGPRCVTVFARCQTGRFIWLWNEHKDHSARSLCKRAPNLSLTPWLRLKVEVGEMIPRLLGQSREDLSKTNQQSFATES